MDMQVLVNQQKLVQTQDVIWKTYQEQWMIGTYGGKKKESAKSTLSGWLDDDDRLSFYMKHLV